LRWLIILTIVAIPLVLFVGVAIVLFLLLVLILSPVFYVLALLLRLKPRRQDRVIEVDYWVRRDD
jgi:O-antigen/teichoic acid export membrane protein